MWANIVKASAPAPSPGPALFTSAEACKVLIVDANAIINGQRLEPLADKFVTIQEVLDEVRDKQSRAFLASMAVTIEVAEPTEESVKAVTRFARATGDIHALSGPDLKLLALAHTLEAAAHGTAHLRAHPSQPVLRSRHRAAGKALPGWGRVDNPEDWHVVDEADADDSGGGAGGVSRIAARVQALNLDGSAAVEEVAEEGRAAPFGGAAMQQREQQPQQQQEQQQEQPIANGSQQGKHGAQAAAAGQGEEDSEDDDDEAGGGGDDGGGDDGWEQAAKSRGAARRRKRKETRRQQRQAEFEAEWAEHSEMMQQRAAAADAAVAAKGGPEGAAGAGEEQEEAEGGDGDAAPQEKFGLEGVYAADEEDDDEEDEDEEEEGSGAEGNDGTGAQQAGAGDAGSGSGANSSSSSSSGAAGDEEQGRDAGGASRVAAGAGATVEADTAWDLPSCGGDGDGHGGSGNGNGSSVAVLTADFPMQNVLLQMGLRLLSRDGRVITRLSRWALRCGACFFVTREAGRLFCPKCGAMGLDRVEVAVGADGAEYYGVPKRHNLRGTRYSLPKPKGGRNSTDPVLREDVFLLKVKALGRRPGGGKGGKGGKGGAAGAGAGGGGDAAAALGAYDDGGEFGDADAAGGAPSQAQLALHRGLAAVLTPAWKRNPNVPKPTRSSRRK